MRKKRTLLITSPIVVIILASLYFVFAIQNNRAEGTISQLEPAAERVESAEKVEKEVSLNGKYVQFNYPAHYRKIPSQKNTNLETINLLSSPSQGGEIAVIVTQGQFDENSALKLRRLQKEIYTEEAAKIPSSTGFVFTKQPPGFEKTAIVEYNGMVASIAITSSVGRDLSQVFDQVTNSFIWK